MGHYMRSDPINFGRSEGAVHSSGMSLEPLELPMRPLSTLASIVALALLPACTGMDTYKERPGPSASTDTVPEDTDEIVESDPGDDDPTTGGTTPPVTGDGTAPVAIDDAFFANEGELRELEVVGNDNDADGDLDASTVQIVDSPLNGTLTVGANGLLEYEHDSTETETDEFSYTVSDAEGNVSNVATVLLEIMPINDPPEAFDDVAVVDEDAAPRLDLAINDTDIDDGLDLESIEIVDDAAYGYLTVYEDGTVGYNHDGTENFSDTFTYEIYDLAGAVSNTATVTVTINPINDEPDARFDYVSVDEGALGAFDLVLNDSDPDSLLDLTSVAITVQPVYGTLVVNGDGTVDYQHDGSQSMYDYFFYTIDDDVGETSNQAMVSITINPV